MARSKGPIGVSANIASKAIATERGGKMHVQREETEDTKIRREIHDVILQGRLNRKTKDEIVEELNSYESFKKHSDFFESWVEHAMSPMDYKPKQKANKKIKKHDGEER